MSDYFTFPERSSEGYAVTGSERIYEGKIFSLVGETISFPDGSSARRDMVKHGGAVAIAALDDRQQLVMLEQYRPAVGRFLWELPAGLRDVEGEPPVQAARRELVEEAGLEAGSWQTLVDVVSAPGFSNEQARIYLATDLRESSDTSFVREAEEADMVVRRIPLEECVHGVMTGRIVNSLAIAGVLAVSQHVRDPATPLRPADAPWPT
ncbi:ADP-ribose pyrophosphatase [Antricoccus suffuscus]|uniref:ADP-ribose pyrophosphatase n=1 Tax=Antricoccus suffuscus TaxID=1629062 RepID=A0A2T0ZXC9_9ACTN|nr:NUDIX hydrolase [Antricoccus suffuscus]PRZ40934.1 ADP-ribose pyrophosphatase [Antricoccus suffuscus]